MPPVLTGRSERPGIIDVRRRIQRAGRHRDTARTVNRTTVGDDAKIRSAHPTPTPVVPALPGLEQHTHQLVVTA